jgi:hypothetical protein
MFRTSSAHHQESLTVHTASSFCVCVCLRHCLVIYHKLHLLVYLLEYMKMHGPGNIKFVKMNHKRICVAVYM